MVGPETKQLLVIAAIGVAVGGTIFALAYPYIFGSDQSQKRFKTVAATSGDGQKQALQNRAENEKKDHRRKQIQATLKQFEEQSKKTKKRLTLAMMISQAGLDLSVQSFWISSVILGIVIGLGTLIAGAPLIAAVGAGFVGMMGLPRWFIGFLRKRRQAKFLDDFADAIDVMVRGLKAGLPINDAMKIIAAETGPPVGPEFIDVVEGQRVGISMQQGFERMYERMPLSEVNFLAIVLAIQAKTGGNLSEALANLSRVLRERRKMKQKVKAVSQEAKSSAAIIGSLPFVITGGMMVVNPDYMTPLWETSTGHLIIGGSLVFMTLGILVMRQMINFDI